MFLSINPSKIFQNNVLMIKIIHKISKNKINQSEHQYFSKNGFTNATGQFSMLSNSDPIEKISDDSPLKASEAEPSEKQGKNVKKASSVIKRPLAVRLSARATHRIGDSKSVSRNSAQYSTRQTRKGGEND
jgi:hypothetical protein